MTDEELIEAVAVEVSCHLWATIAVGNSDDVSDFPEMPAYVQETYRKAARAVIPVAQAPLLARIAELEKALTICRDKFLEYATLHLAKGTRDGILKSQANADMANLVCGNTLRSTQ